MANSLFYIPPWDPLPTCWPSCHSCSWPIFHCLQISLGCPNFLLLTPPYSGRNICLCFIDCSALSRRHTALSHIWQKWHTCTADRCDPGRRHTQNGCVGYQGSGFNWNTPCGSAPTYLLFIFNKKNQKISLLISQGNMYICHCSPHLPTHGRQFVKYLLNEWK